MADRISKEARSKVMSAVHGRDTKPELLVRRVLSKMGLRYRVDYRMGRYRIDIAFPKRKIAIFIDGCFWHGCPWHSTKPKSNQKYWLPKLRDNITRDKNFRNGLKKSGWKVIRIWEHEIN